MVQPSDRTSTPSQALRVLVVEDNLLIAETICDVLEDCGCTVVGPVPDLPRGQALIDQDREDGARLDGAMLDINLSGILSFPLAAMLVAQGVPFVFMTGYDDGLLFPPEFRKVRRLSKPFDAKVIVEVLEVWGRINRA